MRRGSGHLTVVVLACSALCGELHGQAVEQLTRSGARNGQPAFSAEGSWILFVSDREAGWEVWMTDSGGREMERLTDEEGPVGRPVFAAAGQAVLYYAHRGGRYRLLRFDFDDAESRVVPTGLRDAFRPAPSPSGILVVDGVREDGPGGHELYRLGTPGPTALAPHPGYDSDARWSPDGAWIAFHSDRGAGEFQLQVWLVRADGSSLRRVTAGPSVNAYPAWSPNGRCLVHTVEENGNRDLRVLAPADGWGRTLTTRDGFDGDPVWDPRGGRILFATDRFGGIELAFLNLDDEVRRRCER